jgi:hypothetical protein
VQHGGSLRYDEVLTAAHEYDERTLGKCEVDETAPRRR